MKQILSTQRGVPFFWCGSPVTIDKRDEWGDAADNLQQAPNGAFLKLSSATEISHLVQPNEDKSAPIGWIATSTPGQFDKAPIWVGENIIEPGQTVEMQTLDGPITYTAKEQAMVCYNGDDSGPNMNDGWVQTLAQIRKNYVLD